MRETCEPIIFWAEFQCSVPKAAPRLYSIYYVPRLKSQLHGSPLRTSKRRAGGSDPGAMLRLS